MIHKSEQINEIAKALAQAQLTSNRETEAPLVRKLANEIAPLRKVNARTATKMPLRFFEKVCYGSSACWYWRGAIDQHGYGHFSGTRAHRAAWELFNGAIPKWKMVLHKCDVRSCVNPEHLFIGTQLDNMRDCLGKGRFRFPPGTKASQK